MADQLGQVTPTPFRPKGSKRRRLQTFPLPSFLSKRDVQICLSVFEHKVLTTHQLTDLFFPSPGSARRRLVQLFRLRVLDRFQPLVASGSAPEHYVLGKAGAEVVSAQLARDVKLVYDRNRVKTMMYGPFLHHLLDVNSFFSRLAGACRTTPGFEFAEWRGETRTRDLLGGLVHPDGFARIEGTPVTRSFLLELDRGTERPTRLASKLPGYELVARTDDPPDLLLFCFPTVNKEVSARKVLHHVGIQVATARFTEHHADPLGDNWLPLGSDRRCSMVDIPLDRLVSG